MNWYRDLRSRHPLCLRVCKTEKTLPSVGKRSFRVGQPISSGHEEARGFKRRRGLFLIGSLLAVAIAGFLAWPADRAGFPSGRSTGQSAEPWRQSPWKNTQPTVKYVGSAHAHRVMRRSRNPSAAIRWADPCPPSPPNRLPPLEGSAQNRSRRLMRVPFTTRSSTVTVVCFTANPQRTSKDVLARMSRPRSLMPWAREIGVSLT